jgi:hypothetical protein
MFNVLLLLPSLLFTVSILLGPFLMTPKPGRALGSWAAAPKALGWPAAFLFYLVVSMVIGVGHIWNWVGAAAFIAFFLAAFRKAAPHAGFRRQLRKVRRRLVALMGEGGVLGQEAEQLAQQLIAAAKDPAAVASRLEQAGVPEEQRSSIVALVRDEVTARFRELTAVRNIATTALVRWRSEFSRSFLLATFVLLWFFVVPVPGLFVLKVGPYQTSMLLRDIVLSLGVLLIWAVVGYGIALVFERVRLWRLRLRRQGLGARTREAFEVLQRVTLRPDLVKPHTASGLYALFTDLQTYLDQHSHAYARRCLVQIEPPLRRSGGTTIAES